MFRFFIAMAAIILVIMAVLVSVILYSIRSEVADIRFTVHAEFLDGKTPYVGSGVWELHIEQGRFLAGTRFESVRGEAIELIGPGSRHLFLLRRPTEGGAGLDFGAFPLECTDRTSHSNIDMIAKLRESYFGPCPVDQTLPLLVELTTLDDPKTLQRVPYIQASGGRCEGVCLANLWIERTDESVTTGIESVLPWLELYEYGMRSCPRTWCS